MKIFVTIDTENPRNLVVVKNDENSIIIEYRDLGLDEIRLDDIVYDILT